jgi:hypothetical protein
MKALDDTELAEANQYYDSPVGRKEREIVRSAVSSFDKSTRKSKSGPPNAANRRLVEQLVDLHEIPETLKGIKSSPLSSNEVRDVFIGAYSIMEENELAEAIRFHSSPTGKKCLQAARTAGLQLSRQFDL